MGELAPSIIAADFRRLGAQLDAVAPFAGRWHVDVMDGHYVPNLTIGPMIVEAIAAASALPQDVHLMIANPDESWEWYARAGAAGIGFHASTSADPDALIRRLIQAQIGPGLALNPDEPVGSVEPHLAALDHVIVMSVHPGFSGQRFIPEALPKLRDLRRIIDDRGLDVRLVIDGGVSAETAPACLEAGADVLVSASAVFGAADPAAAARQLAELSSRAAGDRAG